MRSDVTMSTQYGTDGKACVLTVEPRKDFLSRMAAGQTLSMEALTSLLDEVVPPSTRGKENFPLFSAVVAGGCGAAMTWADYENVQMVLSYTFCAEPIGVHSATVYFKRAACPQWPPAGFPDVKLRK